MDIIEDLRTALEQLEEIAGDVAVADYLALFAIGVRCSTGTHAVVRLNTSLESAEAEFLVLGYLPDVSGKHY